MRVRGVESVIVVASVGGLEGWMGDWRWRWVGEDVGLEMRLE